MIYIEVFDIEDMDKSWAKKKKKQHTQREWNQHANQTMSHTS